MRERHLCATFLTCNVSFWRLKEFVYSFKNTRLHQRRSLVGLSPAKDLTFSYK